MNNRDINIVKGHSYNQLAAVGAASGVGNRARTQPSKRDKANCPRRQRKQKDWRSE